STLGGWVVTRSSGQQSLRYGRIEQVFAGGKLETFAGTLEIPTFPASAAGPDLRELVMGSEGRFGIVSEVKVRVTRLAEQERFYAVFFPSWQLALSAIRELTQARVPLSMLRLSNAIETQTQLALAGHPGQISLLEKYLALRGAGVGKCMMTFGVTGNRQQNAASLKQAKKLLKGFGGVFTGTLLGNKWAEGRFRFPYLRHGLWEAGYAVDTLETATDWSNVDNLLNKLEGSLREALREDGEQVHVFTHLSHVYGEGSSIYTSYVFRPAATYAGTYARWQKLKHAACTTIANNRGTISHQHGVGRDPAPYLAVEKGELGMAALKAMAGHFDPDGRLNPGVLLQD
ncbi:MAG: FAD-binding oxidoreductase, partial [Pseudomonas sp. PGPPP3]